MGVQAEPHPAEAEKTGKGEQAAAEDGIDVDADRHAGQFALRKLYHASPRPMVVFYSSPTCGPCRSLKPVFSRILDEFSGKVCPSLKLFITASIAMLPAHGLPILHGVL